MARSKIDEQGQYEKTCFNTDEFTFLSDAVGEGAISSLAKITHRLSGSFEG
jgi:hypothetical protein